MIHRCRHAFLPVPLAAALALLCLAPGHAVAEGPGDQPTLPPGPATEPAAATAGATVDDPPTWPRAIHTQGGTALVYQPQVEKLEGITLSGRAAVSWEAAGQPPVFGVFWFKAQLAIDKDAGTVDVETIKVTRVRFPNSTPEGEAKAARLLEAEIPEWDLGGSLEELTAALAASDQEARTAKGLKAQPPKFLFSRDPAVLLLYDGAPVVRPLEGTSLERAVNTPLLVLRDPAEQRFFLMGGTSWYRASAATGPWQPVADPSPAVKAYVAKNPPPAPEAEAGGAAEAQRPQEPAAPPLIVVATEPTELVVFDGAPNYVPVAGEPDLLFADNADARVLVHVPSGETYVLAAGRWFKARTLAGPFATVRPDQLPPAFARIPAGSPVADVRTFVAGTDEARDALADAQVPQTTAVKRDQTLTVTYDGEPRFKPIEGTKLAFAENTPYSVLRDGGRYWACHQAVWYVAPTPTGPWAVSDRRPPSIDQVPPSAPVYNTRYVYVYQSTPSVVYVGYLPGYVGVYPYYGAVVYGTGYAYRPYVGPAAYYPRPATFGIHVTYSPWSGFGVGVSYGTPFFSIGAHFGGHEHHHGWYGPGGYYRPPHPPYGYRPPPPGYRPSVGYPRPSRPGYAAARPPSAVGGRPVAARPNLYGRPENAPRNEDRDRRAVRRKPTVPASTPNNLFGDRTGNVYRQNQGGHWDRSTRQGWAPHGGAEPPSRSGGRPGGVGGGPGGAAKGGAKLRPPAGGGVPAGLARDAAARGRHRR